jgi:putative transcriptional regulator
VEYQDRKSVRKTAPKGFTVRVKAAKPRATKSYRSAAFAAIHEAADGLHKAGMIDNTTMREFDQDCLTPIIELSPAMIRKIRIGASISQSVFAAHLNVTTGVVSKWERGEKQPRGPAAKLLSLAAKHGIASIA